MTRRRFVATLSVGILALLVLEAGEAWARASSGGSRGSRSYSSPASPTTPTSPSRSVTSPTTPAAPQRPGFFGGLGGMLGGLLIGGLLGSLLFGGQGGFGIGLLEIVLVAGGIMLLLSFLRRRQTAAPAYATAGGGTWTQPTETAAPEPVAVESDLDRGVGHIRAMDARFDPAVVATSARSVFVDVQRAVTARDITSLRDRLTPDMLTVLQKQCDQLRGARQTNRMDQIEIRRAAVTEAWQEGGQDYVTVCLDASLLDYVVDDSSGAVVDGSRSTAQEIEEYWTFTRPVGPNAWKLSAIQTG